MKTMYDCGRYTHQIWRANLPHITRWLGPYNPDLPASEVSLILEHDKLTQEAQYDFIQGYEAERLNKTHG